MVKGIGKEFIKKTTYQFMDPSDQNKGVPQPPLEAEYDSSRPLIKLIEPSQIDVPQISLRESIEARQSIRAYSNETLSLNELSWLLWSTQGIRNKELEIIRSNFPDELEIEEIKNFFKTVTLRNVPSAGARHAFETFLLINRVESLEPGLYRYIATRHKLLEISKDPDLPIKIKKAAYDQSIVLKSAVTFIWIANSYRMAWRYGERGYRYLLLDAGHVCQNLYLSAENIKCGVCAIAAYHDSEFNELLGLDGLEQFVIYLATVGKKRVKVRTQS
ncbi:MAG: SagB/ThcOx family dehydrogenase [Candidatus Hodarchaeales archaeon]|jgi:SagB-type dehydrogenase family enzyme